MKIKLIAGLVAILATNIINAAGNVTLQYDSAPDFRGQSSAESEINAAFSNSAKVFSLDFEIGGSVGVRDGVDDERRGFVSTGVDTKIVDLSVGVIGYNNNVAIGDGYEVYVEAGADIILSPTARIYYQPDEQVVTVEGSIKQVFKITDLISVEATGSVGSTEVKEVRDTYYGGGLTLKYKVGKNTYAFVGADATEYGGLAIEDVDYGIYLGVSHSY